MLDYMSEGEISVCEGLASSLKTDGLKAPLEVPISATCQLAQTWTLCFRQLSQGTPVSPPLCSGTSLLPYLHSLVPRAPGIPHG